MSTFKNWYQMYVFLKYKNIEISDWLDKQNVSLWGMREEV